MKLYFQKIAFVLSLPLLLCSFFTPTNSYALAPIDQKCITEGSGNGVVGYDRNTRTTPDFQFFVPTKNTLDAISIRISGPTIALRMEVINAATGETIASMIKSFDGMEQWLTFDFNDVPMPRSLYLIAVSNVNANMTYYWKYRTECYSQGYAIMNYQEYGDTDLGFSVHAYDSSSGSQPQPPADPPVANPPSGGGGNNGGSSTPPAGGGTSPLGISPGTHQPPSVKTSSAISPPTSLSAKDSELDYGGSVDLSWKASTTADIDGYKLFRRAEGDWEYIEILRLPKSFTHFTDPWATKDKTYYYMLRAYKGNSESPNSNIASATSKDDLNPLIKDIKEDAKKNSKGGLLAESGLFLIIPVVIVLIIIGLFILGLWVLFHKKKQSPPATPSK